METSDKERIEKAAVEHSNSFNPSEHIHSEEQIRQLKYYAKKDFKIGAEYERTIANQQLKEKDKELFELKEEADKQLTFLRNRLSEDREQLAEKDKEINQLTRDTVYWRVEAEAKFDEVQEKDKEIENLKSVMVAAAEEIKLHWMAHCDEEGYGPSNLLNRLEKGLASSYSGYKPGNIEKMEKEIASLKEALSKALSYVTGYEPNQYDEKEQSETIQEIENLLKG